MGAALPKLAAGCCAILAEAAALLLLPALLLLRQRLIAEVLLRAPHAVLKVDTGGKEELRPLKVGFGLAPAAAMGRCTTVAAAK